MEPTPLVRYGKEAFRIGRVAQRVGQAADISADLHELTRCPVGLVSAGVKSILDIGRLVFNGLFDD